jgi:UDP-N-acetylmuramoyl-L-alanyl-D-glutamate--2,6-diaminopimelate ligase
MPTTPSTDAAADLAEGRGPRPLGELLERVGVAPEMHGESIPVRGITSDSSAVREGFVFVALRGTSADRHAFVGDAVTRGAAAVVVQDCAALLPPSRPPR